MQKYLNVLYYEILLRIREIRRYKMQIFSEAMMFVLIFIACIVSDWGSSFIYELGVSKDDSIKFVFIGYMIWQIGCIALGYSSNFIKTEATEGILEVKQQSVFSYEVLLFFRMLISVITSISISVIATCILMLFWGWTFEQYVVCIKALFLGIPVIVGMFGMGLFFGAAVLHEKNIGKSVMIVQAVLLFFSNVFSTTKSKWILIFPYTWAIDIGRDMYLEKKTGIVRMGIYFIINIVWLLGGHLVFRKALEDEKLKGMFDNY